MRSMFWRIFASFWLAVALVSGLSLLLSRALNQDAWVLSHHPALANLAERWSQTFEEQGTDAAQRLLEKRKKRFRVDTQVLDDNGQNLVSGTFPARAAAYEARQSNDKRLPWRRLTEEYTSPSGETYLFIYRIPHPELMEWHRGSLFWPISALGIALIVLTAISILLTLSITRPLGRLRSAVHDLGQTAYQQHSLERLSNRSDEFGVLAQDFNRMGSRLQDLIGSQRQLLRDVSHELRSPLARLRVALALAERAEPAQREQLWGRLTQECDRLEALIGEILALARLDADPGAPQPVDLHRLIDQLRADAALGAPDHELVIRMHDHPSEFSGWPDMLARALDNLIRNALRFSPAGSPVEVDIKQDSGQLLIAIRDHGPGAPPELLEHLGEPFFRAPNQAAPGHGLGLAITRRAAERHGGRLLLTNHPEGGFIATLELPLAG
ncbi:HAMP domain-containing histidine kinase [Pseudomonas sp. PDM16]|uniref:sensor histidine kinase n=1 Tax=Pseudomonas sp. PDM16 TaxID=2769292 RepID=UPI0017835BE9|nr:HAMP domain-containing sensor histidine kinase [Pseudomonas sp. PDM16]MBD9414736.1 HAMP domain-containing histidine kinase [Pseudomonas sp. PDM16]